jgi:hypothetical protein
MNPRAGIRYLNYRPNADAALQNFQRVWFAREDRQKKNKSIKKPLLPISPVFKQNRRFVSRIVRESAQ